MEGNLASFSSFCRLCLFLTNLLIFLCPCHDLICIFYNIRRILNTLTGNSNTVVVHRLNCLILTLLKCIMPVCLN